MWPFSKKEPKESFEKIALKELMDFRPIGGKFKYLGVEMIVYGYGEWIDCYPPLLKCNYVDNHGVIHSACFQHSELPALRAENP